jgi:cytochrome bd-type quinol oxidase subunit 2
VRAKVEQRGRVSGHPIPEVVLRTRRSVMAAAHEIRTKREQRRQHAGIALAAMAGLLVLAAPGLWYTVNDLTTGEHFQDLPVAILTISLIMVAAIFAILLMTWRGRRGAERGE